VISALRRSTLKSWLDSVLTRLQCGCPYPVIQGVQAVTAGNREHTERKYADPAKKVAETINACAFLGTIK
jgi:hypothetical protein